MFDGTAKIMGLRISAVKAGHRVGVLPGVLLGAE